MNDKSTITYWLKKPGEEGGEIDLFSIDTIKVPEKGEVINIHTLIDKTWIENRFSHLSEKQLNAFLPSEDKRVRGDYVVVDVKRWLKTKQYPRRISGSDLAFESNNITTESTVEIPMECVIENFEVFIEPFRHTELTETPIAKLRNLLGPIFGSIDMLNLIAEHPDKKEELLELFKSNIENTKEAIEKVRELISFDKNWR